MHFIFIAALLVGYGTATAGPYVYELNEIGEWTTTKGCFGGADWDDVSGTKDPGECLKMCGWRKAAGCCQIGPNGCYWKPFARHEDSALNDGYKTAARTYKLAYPECQGDRYRWNLGQWGDCSVWNDRDQFHPFCNVGVGSGDNEGLFASQVCRECGTCEANNFFECDRDEKPAALAYSGDMKSFCASDKIKAWAMTSDCNNYGYATGSDTRAEARSGALMSCQKSHGEPCQIFTETAEGCQQPPYSISVTKTTPGRECKEQTLLLGSHGTSEACAQAGVFESQCDAGVFMFSAANTNWGCRCCTSKDSTGKSNASWDLYSFETGPPEAADAVSCDVEIIMTTETYPTEISWSISDSTCFKNKDAYATKNTVYQPETCCLNDGDYTLTCTDDYGDGWNGGYIQIGGVKMCDKFGSGKSATKKFSVTGAVVSGTVKSNGDPWSVAVGEKQRHTMKKLFQKNTTTM